MPNRTYDDLHAKQLVLVVTPRSMMGGGSVSLEDLEADAEGWVAAQDVRSGVGARHHVVPRFYLQRWAAANRVQVYSRVDEAITVRNVRDLGDRDFYTFINTDNESDGRFEKVLAYIEGRGDQVLKKLLSPFAKPARLAENDENDLAPFLGFQYVRGKRRRREIELLADYYAKTVNGHLYPNGELEQVEFVPHQNDHIGMMGPMALQVYEQLVDREAIILTFDDPSLLTGDEPLVIGDPGADTEPEHHRHCSMSNKELQAEARRSGTGEFRRVVHVYPSNPRGLIDAQEISIPLSPRTMLVLGPQGERHDSRPVIRVSGQEAKELTEVVNARIMRNSVDVVVASPDYADFDQLAFPPPDEILNICDGVRRPTDTAAMRRRPRRFWRPS